MHDICGSVGTVLPYLILVTLLIYGDNEFGNVRDELVALGFPQCLHTDIKVFDQDFLKRVAEKKIQLSDSQCPNLHYQQGSFYIRIQVTL